MHFALLFLSYFTYSSYFSLNILFTSLFNFHKHGFIHPIFFNLFLLFCKLSLTAIYYLREPIYKPFLLEVLWLYVDILSSLRKTLYS